MIFIQAFDFELIYRKGSENQVAECLSRPVREVIVEKTDRTNLHRLNFIKNLKI